jgi:hypothetical protein
MVLVWFSFTNVTIPRLRKFTIPLIITSGISHKIMTQQKRRVSGFPLLIKQTTITTGDSAVSHIGI